MSGSGVHTRLASQKSFIQTHQWEPSGVRSEDGPTYRLQEYANEERASYEYDEGEKCYISRESNSLGPLPRRWAHLTLENAEAQEGKRNRPKNKVWVDHFRRPLENETRTGGREGLLASGKEGEGDAREELLPQAGISWRWRRPVREEGSGEDEAREYFQVEQEFEEAAAGRRQWLVAGRFHSERDVRAPENERQDPRATPHCCESPLFHLSSVLEAHWFHSSLGAMRRLSRRPGCTVLNPLVSSCQAHGHGPWELGVFRVEVVPFAPLMPIPCMLLPSDPRP